MSDGKNILESFRDVAQELLVPELKAVKVSVEALREEMKQMRADMKQSNEILRADMKASYEAMREEMRLRNENLERLITYGDQRTEQLVSSLASKFDTAVEIRERLAHLEARLPRQ